MTGINFVLNIVSFHKSINSKLFFFFPKLNRVFNLRKKNRDIIKDAAFPS
jgi:hypothetical protein